MKLNVPGVCLWVSGVAVKAAVQLETPHTVLGPEPLYWLRNWNIGFELENNNKNISNKNNYKQSVEKQGHW